jgi:hypothetical protein
MNDKQEHFVSSRVPEVMKSTSEDHIKVVALYSHNAMYDAYLLEYPFHGWQTGAIYNPLMAHCDKIHQQEVN